jgi:hypothetical protein
MKMTYDPNHPGHGPSSPARALLPFFALVLVLALIAVSFGHFAASRQPPQLAAPLQPAAQTTAKTAG